MLKFSGHPPRDIVPEPRLSEKCKVCGGHSPMFDVVDFWKHGGSGGENYQFGLSGIPIYLYRCDECQFIFIAAFDKWGSKEFSNYIYNDDYVKVDGDYLEKRPSELAVRFQKLFENYADVSILDYGSGSGLMAAKMREMGFSDVETYDPFSNPSRPTRQFDFVLSTEVVEHSTDPLGTFADMNSLVAPDGAILFTTGLQPPDISLTRAGWWYMAPRNGHVSFYSIKSLILIAEKTGFQYFSGDFHCFKRPTASETTKIVTRKMDCPQIFSTLYAPAASSTIQGWCPIERDLFRWTNDQHLEWKLPPVEERSHVTFEVPFINEIQRDFAAACRFTVGGRAQSGFVERRGDTLFLRATIIVDPSDYSVELETPVPIRPSDLGGSEDNRALGLAVLISERRDGANVLRWNGPNEFKPIAPTVSEQHDYRGGTRDRIS